MNDFLFEDLRDKKSFLFSGFIDSIFCQESSELPEVFQRIEKELSIGNYLAGYFTFEAGIALSTGEDIRQTPLIHLSVFKNMESKKTVFDQTYPITISSMRSVCERDFYLQAVSDIREEISKGNVYQVNYTFPLDFDLKPDDTKNFYEHLKSQSSVRYAVYYKNEKGSVISLSPELFFSRYGVDMEMKPMKGTIHRGRYDTEDFELKNFLQQDSKNRAENAMIVDLVRNDLGKISVNGSVKTENLFAVEKYETLFQMVSTIKSKLKKDCTWEEIFKSIFPSGSVTGAPKVASLNIIRQLEKTPRGVYTGAIGFITPEQNALFNVSIRTIEARMKSQETASNHFYHTYRLGIGSGIVWDSDPETEFNESLLKGSFLHRTTFNLIETLLYQNGRFRFLENHLARLKETADFFLFHYNEDEVKQKIKSFSISVPFGSYRIRFVLEHNGNFIIESSPLGVMKKFGKVILSKIKTDSSNTFFYHKTTLREIYNAEYAHAQKMGVDDIVFTNQDGYLTEGCISNIFLKKNGFWYTPHWQAGLLKGIYRNYLLAKWTKIKEEYLTIDDLYTAEEIFICNSLRGITKVQLQKDSKQ